MKAIKILPFILVTLFATTACENTSPKSESRQIPYRIVKEEGHKTTITSSNGVPLVITSVEFRSDLLQLSDGLKPSEMEDYFALAKETNFNTIDLPIMWSEIEVEEGIYNFEGIKSYLDLAKKYNLKINVLWYGSFVDGETHTANMPKYISNDSVTYPVIKKCYQNSVFGDTWIMNWSNKQLLTKEGNAIKQLFNYIASWNLENEKYNPVVIFQCGQGLDRLERYRIEQYDVKMGDEIMSIDQARIFVEDYAYAVSKAAKASNYCPITRVEFCEQSAITSYVRNVEEISSIDVLSSTYLYTVPLTKIGIVNFANEYGEYKPVMNSENWADDNNYRNALVTYAMGGCGFTTYNLSSPLYYPMESKISALYRRKDTSKETIQDKFTQINDRAEKINTVNSMINKSFFPVSKTTKENYALFGFDSKTIREEGVQKVYLDSGIMLDYRADEESSFGFAMYHDNYVYVISSSDGKLSISNCFIQNASVGGFDQDGFWQKEESVIVEDDSIEFKKGKLYRIRTNDILELPTDEELEARKYKTTIEIVKG